MIFLIYLNLHSIFEYKKLKGHTNFKNFQLEIEFLCFCIILVFTSIKLMVLITMIRNFYMLNTIHC